MLAPVHDRSPMSGANPDPHYFAQDKNRSPYNYLSRRGCENGRRLARILDTSKSRMPLDVKHAGLTALKKRLRTGRTSRTVHHGALCKGEHVPYPQDCVGFGKVSVRIRPLRLEMKQLQTGREVSRPVKLSRYRIGTEKPHGEDTPC